MQNLFLASLHEGLYVENTACAYIYYGTNEDIRDHRGHKIGMFMKAEDQIALTDHVTKNILPMVQDGLKGTRFSCSHVDFLNMAPHPHIVISVNGVAKLNDKDLNELSDHLNRIIMNANCKKRKTNKTTLTNLTKLFHEQENLPLSDEQTSPRATYRPG